MISLSGRVLINTAKGYIGLAPSTARKGDTIAIIAGCSYPVLLRDAGLGRGWRVIGEVYVRGIMDGEGVSAEEWERERTFRLC